MNYLHARPDFMSLHFPIVNPKFWDATVPDKIVSIDDGFHGLDFEDFFMYQLYSVDHDQYMKLDETLNFYGNVFSDFFASFFGEDVGLFFSSKYMHLNTYNNDYFFDDYYMNEENEFLDYLSDDDDSYYYVGDDDLEVAEGNQNIQATATLSDMEFDDDDLDPSLRESEIDEFDLIRSPLFLNFFDEFDFFVTPFYFDSSEYSLTHIYYFASLNSFFLFNFLLKRPKFYLFGISKFSILDLLFYFKFFFKSFTSIFDIFYRARFWNIGYCYSMSINMVTFSFFLPQFFFLNLFPSSYFINNFLQNNVNFVNKGK